MSIEMSMKTFDVASLIQSPSALTREQGFLIYEKILPHLKEGKKVVLDFKDIERIIIPFLNVSIGKLYEDFGSNQLNTQLQFEHLPEGNMAKFQTVIENAKRYYLNKSEFNSAVEEIID